MGEVEFQQRWEYRSRGNDVDSSCDDSKSSNELLLKRHKLVSSSNSVGNDETSETSRLKQKGNENAGKARKRRTKNVSNNNPRKSRRKRDSHEEVDLQKSRRKRDSRGEVDLQKGETSGHGSGSAPLNDVKTFMESLLEDLRVARENIVKEMMEEIQKIGAYDTIETIPEVKRRKRGRRGEKVQLQKKKESGKVEDQHEKTPEESTQFQQPNGLVESFQFQKHHNFQENSNMQVQLEEESFNRLQQNNFEHGTRIQNCKNQLGTSSPDETVRVEGHNKTVVLAIEAPKSKGRSCKRTVRGKKTVDQRSNLCQVPEDQGFHGQVDRTAVVSDKTNGEKLLGSSNFPYFPSSSSGQAPSSMYLTLPSVLTEPLVPNQVLDPSFCNYNIPQRVADQKKRDVNPLQEANFNQVSFPLIQQEQRIRSFDLMGSRSNCFSQNNNIPLTSGFGTGFPVPFHQAIDVTPEYRGATSFPGGSYNLSEHFAANHHHMHSAYKSGGSRLMSYPIQNIKDGHLFSQ